MTYRRTEMEHDVGQELVKCVLVGDTAVGKTRLICARACNLRASLRQLFSTHVPTVFAIDQYRMYKEVLERSMSSVDGVQVSLRLWDTFGDHEKDRRFAYGRSDVILLCFSIGSRSSLLHCKTMWYPEIRRFCPDTPVLLVGCKNDLRFLIRDPAYSNYCRERSPFFRPVRESDLVMAEQARVVAKELNLAYYETSVYTLFGVDAVFENAIRASLLARRSQRFWMTNLKHVRQPLLQAPYCPPKKQISCVKISPGDYWNDIENMSIDNEFVDIIFHIGNIELSAHRFIMESSLSRFIGYVNNLEKLGDFERRNSDSSSESGASVCSEGEWLLGSVSNFHEITTEFENPTFVPSSNETIDREELIELNFSFSQIIHKIQFPESSNEKIIVTLSPNISPDAFQIFVYFMYLGEFPKNFTIIPQDDLLLLSNLFESQELKKYLEFYCKNDRTMMTRFTNSYHASLSKMMWKNCIEKYTTDVVFHLDDGYVAAHRAILACRSDVMKAMFSGNFKERKSRNISLPGITTEVFWYFLEYIYTDKVDKPISVDISILLIEFANRLCLSRLIKILENILIAQMSRDSDTLSVSENCIRILERAQLHNAERLSEFCMIFIATNYDDISRNHGKLFKELDPENRQWVLNNRWPPVWYVKDLDYYHKTLKERCKLETEEKKGRKRNNSGCLCFSQKSKRGDKNETDSEFLTDEAPNAQNNGSLTLLTFSSQN